MTEGPKNRNTDRHEPHHEREVHEDATEDLRAANHQNLREFGPVHIARLVVVTGVKELVAHTFGGWEARRSTRVLGQVQVDQQNARVQLVLAQTAGAIGIARFKGPLGEALEKRRLRQKGGGGKLGQEHTGRSLQLATGICGTTAMWEKNENGEAEQNHVEMRFEIFE